MLVRAAAYIDGTLAIADWRLRKRTAAKRIAQTCARKIVRD